jgi:LytR cell envelope-related transcriptional attenuator
LVAIVQEIGAVAGWAAVVGLAVLSALYFSQARDVKRLREWAGRAPERSGPGVTAVPGRAAGVPPPAQPQTAATASGAPASLTGVRPATAAGASGPPPVAPQPVRRTPSPQRPITTPAALRAVPQETVISPPRRFQAWYSRIGTRYVAVALVGLLVFGGAAAYGVTQLTGDDSGDNSGNAQANNDKRNGAAVKPGNVTFAVLNGTTVPGLAAALRDQIAAAGFKKGTINDFSDQQLAESVVQYAPGHQAEAKAVSRTVGISQREPVTADSRALAGGATVIVIAGADKAP